MAKVAPLKQGKSSWKSKALDPFSDRLYSGVVVYSKSWKEDLWLYFKNEHILASCLFAHPEHPFSPNDRFLVVSISLMVAFGLNCCFSSAGEGSLATILALTVGVVVQSIFDSSLKFFSTCPCVQKGCMSRIWLLKCCCLCLGKCFTGVCCCVGLGVLLLGTILLAIHQPQDFGFASGNFAYSKVTAFFGSTVASCLISYLMARRAQMRPFLIDPEARNQYKEMDWIQNGFKTQEEVVKATKKWAAKKIEIKCYKYPWIIFSCFFCACCCYFGGGPPDMSIWQRFFCKENSKKLSNGTGDDEETGSGTKQKGDDLVFGNLWTFYDLPDHAPLYPISIDLGTCHQSFSIRRKYNQKEIPKDYLFQLPGASSSSTTSSVEMAQGNQPVEPEITAPIPQSMEIRDISNNNDNTVADASMNNPEEEKIQAEASEEMLKGAVEVMAEEEIALLGLKERLRTLKVSFEAGYMTEDEYAKAKAKELGI
mmetsp:Transcript_59463/g.116644  ORF Transcript_59463/g.116644 Transcript_59463/m.116644 type:complete len:481 (+) Transcript_59463:104-1546(+)